MIKVKVVNEFRVFVELIIIFVDQFFLIKEKNFFFNFFHSLYPNIKQLFMTLSKEKLINQLSKHLNSYKNKILPKF
jgi:hypothetical protein